MDAEQVGKVIDKIAEKAGVAVEAMQPLAETVVRQVQMRGLVYALLGAIMVCAAITMFRASHRYALSSDCPDNLSHIPIAVFDGIASIVFCILGMALMIDGFAAWVAPIPTILGL